MKKILLSGITAGAVMLVAETIIHRFFNVVFPSLEAEFRNAALFRPWSDPAMSLYFIYPFVLGIILAWAWHKMKPVHWGTTVGKRGRNFGFALWVITGIPGMLISYASFPLSLLMITSWAVSGLIDLLLAGWIYAKMNP